MKRNRLDSTFHICLLFSMVALFTFGCASQKPAAPAVITEKTEPKAADNYLVYALNTKKAYSEVWTLGTNAVVTTEPLLVKTKVTIARDGKVESAQILESSGNEPFDESVQLVLDWVKFVQPFGADAKDERRTFVIDFQLKPRP